MSEEGGDEFRPAPKWQRWLVVWIATIPLIILTGIRLQMHAEPIYIQGRVADFAIFIERVRMHERGGPLYATQEEGFATPASHVYKYPPLYAAILTLFLTDEPRPSLGVNESREVKRTDQSSRTKRQLAKARESFALIRHLFVAELLILAASLGLLLVALRPSVGRGIVSALVFLNWQPFWESLSGLQLEVWILFLLVLSLVFLRRVKSIVAGVMVGLAGALKVYPGAIVLYFGFRRDWMALLGTSLGVLLAVGFSSAVLTSALWLEYLFDVLPKLGGTALAIDNVSLLANLGRIAVFLLGGQALFMSQVVEQDYAILEGHSVPFVHFASMLAFAIVMIGLLSVTIRAFLRAEGLSPQRKVTLVWSMGICLLVTGVPTSWTDYQTLLALPMVCAITEARAFRSDRLVWILLLAAALPATMVFSHDPTSFAWAHPWIYLVARSAIPIAIWGALYRTLQSAPVGLEAVTSEGD